MGGLWPVAPRLGGASMFFALASLGLPGMGNFVGEFMVVLGVYPAHPGLAVAASLGFVFSTAYALRMIQRICFGENREGWKIPDLSLREMAHNGADDGPPLVARPLPAAAYRPGGEGQPVRALIPSRPSKPHLPGDTLPAGRRK